MPEFGLNNLEIFCSFLISKEDESVQLNPNELILQKMMMVLFVKKYIKNDISPGLS